MRLLWRIIFLTAVFFSFCADLDRDNVLDPKNSSSRVPRKNLVEVFVNDSTGYPYSHYALDALDDIRSRNSFSDNLLILEYHVENENWNDLYEQSDCLTRYHKYVPDPAERGIPDAFFNGAANRVQGASSDYVKNRYLEQLAELTEQDAYFQIVGEKTIENNLFRLNLQIAKLGSRSESDLILQAVIIEDKGVARHRAVVRKILSAVTISEINAGEVKSFSFEATLANDEDPSQTFAVVFIQKSDAGREVFQAEKF
ncbi:MAG: hypothetical protein GXO74_01835 [Calditrichaeota bacterium]|nr:hypothetical protein [Calditrichota bacterium]